MAEQPREGNLRIIVQVLTAKDQHAVPVHRALEFRHRRLGQGRGEVQTQDLVREPFVQFPNRQLHRGHSTMYSHLNPLPQRFT